VCEIDTMKKNALRSVLLAAVALFAPSVFAGDYLDLHLASDAIAQRYANPWVAPVPVTIVRPPVFSNPVIAPVPVCIVRPPVFSNPVIAPVPVTIVRPPVFSNPVIAPVPVVIVRPPSFANPVVPVRPVNPWLVK
jgi:hypothetical protein